MINETIRYYDENAESFIGGTLDADISQIAGRFVERLPEGASILDWGCGSGRDSLAFLKAGFDVTAVDLSREMAAATERLTGLRIRNESFEDLSDVHAYDGIWACSSLLHVSKVDLPVVLGAARKALWDGGCAYVSFKYGDYEGMRNGRYFTDLTEEALASILKDGTGLRIDECWVTSDVRPGRENEKWLNAILVKERSIG